MEPTDILKKVPKNTPSWAIGLTSVLISFALCLGSIYIAVRPEVQQYIGDRAKVQTAYAESEKTTTGKLFELITTNTNQITALSISLSSAQENNLKLSERVAAIEKELAVTSATLTECESRLVSKK